MRHAGRHDGEEFGFREPGEERLDGQRGFRLPHEDAGCHVERFRAAHPHDLLHPNGHGFHDELHHAKVIQDGEKGGDEDDDRQHLEGENHAERAALGAERAEQKLAAHLGVVQHGVHAIADPLEDQAEVRLQHQHREGKLQTHAPQNQAELDFFLMSGEQPRDSQDDGESQETREPPHYPTTSRMSSRSSGFCEETWNASSTISAASSTRSSLV